MAGGEVFCVSTGALAEAMDEQRVVPVQYRLRRNFNLVLGRFEKRLSVPAVEIRVIFRCTSPWESFLTLLGYWSGVDLCGACVYQGVTAQRDRWVRPSIWVRPSLLSARPVF